MAFTQLQTKLNKALVTNDAGDYAVRTVMDGEQDLNGNYLLNDQTTTNMMSKGTVYRFDGVDDVISASASTDFDISVDGSAIQLKFNIANLSSNVGLLGRYGNSSNRWGVYVTSSGALSLFNEVGGAVKSLSLGNNSISAGVDHDVIIVLDSSGTNAVYINGVSASIESDDISGQELYSSNPLDIGQWSDAEYLVGEISEVKLFNFAPTASEVKDLISGNLPFKWQYGSQTALTSGTLEIGQEYIIDDWITNDDFTNVGGTNEDGNIFVATGTTPTTWTNSSSLRALGAVALYDKTSISETQWYDKANGNDGAVTGASVLNQPVGDAHLGIALTPQAQPSNPTEGMVIYNSATNKLNVWNGSAWEVVTSS